MGEQVRNIFKKKKEVVAIKMYKYSLIVMFRDNIEERWSFEAEYLRSIFKWKLYKDFYRWFYLRDSENFTIRATVGTTNSRSMKTFQRKDIRLITGIVEPFDKVIGE